MRAAPAARMLNFTDAPYLGPGAGGARAGAARAAIRGRTARAHSVATAAHPAAAMIQPMYIIAVWNVGSVDLVENVSSDAE